MLNEINEFGKRKILNDVLVDFIFKCWKKYVYGDDGIINWYYYEMVVLIELKNYICLGDIFVVGSRFYKDFEEYFVFKEDWKIICFMEIKLVVCLLVDEYFEERRKLLV